MRIVAGPVDPAEDLHEGKANGQYDQDDGAYASKPRAELIITPKVELSRRTKLVAPLQKIFSFLHDFCLQIFLYN